MQQLSGEQLEAAMLAARVLTDPTNPNAVVPMRHAAGALLLHNLAGGILSGEYVVSFAEGKEAQAPADLPKAAKAKE